MSPALLHGVRPKKRLRDQRLRERANQDNPAAFNRNQTDARCQRRQPPDARRRQHEFPGVRGVKTQGLLQEERHDEIHGKIGERLKKIGHAPRAQTAHW